MDIKSVILRHGMQIQQVAQAMGMKQSSLSAIIAGNPTAKTLQSIAKTIGCPVIEFFMDEVPEDYDMQALIARREPEGLPTNDKEEDQLGAPGVFVCPHCGAGISFNAFTVKEPTTI